MGDRNLGYNNWHFKYNQNWLKGKTKREIYQGRHKNHRPLPHEGAPNFFCELNLLHKSRHHEALEKFKTLSDR